MKRKRLPIGIQTFSEIREDDCYYVDKTQFAVELVRQGKYYFLSRPRRFGKSLFLDTLKELFEGNRALFTGLYAENNWDWSVRYPVIKISFGGGVLGSREDLIDSIDGQMLRYESGSGLQGIGFSIRRRFMNLIIALHEQTGKRVVVLVDEYDKPILDRIEDEAIALEIREGLKDLYSVIKEADAHIKFAFLTGVSKFSKVSLFSGLNNLQDITLDSRYSAICGYTEHDVDRVFGPELDGLDREAIRAWYNGYNWTGETVYNPFDLLLLFSTRQFRPYWFETGTPTFLTKLLMERKQFTPDLERIVAPETLLSTFDVGNIPVEALLFQTGYLTIASVRDILGLTQIVLRYPNLEVRTSLNRVLLAVLTGDPIQYGMHATKLYDLLLAGDFEGLRSLFHAFYASIPHQWYTGNTIAQYEGFYVSVFYSYFAALGLDIRTEESTNRGRIDMAVVFAGRVYLFEFKVVEETPEGKAIQQLRDKGYAEKYRALGFPIHLVGVEFSKVDRNIVGFDVDSV
ncbi:ATP-binding protein [Desulfatirhabdium butyrativorans]|uniref:ATP-binding protein n=1 Tax=Desulfatirhabdium butyrativorans TaxID=340467 RepID=UPI000416AAB6|nr:ATP-binding protein [Desulfatirhabdium butyrativorans]